MWFIQSIAENLTNQFTSMIDAEKLEWESVVANIADPFAKEIEWTPLARGGASISTHNIVMNPNGNLEFQTTQFPKMLSGFFIGFGIFIDIVLTLDFLSSGTFDLVSILPFIIPSLFVVGWILAYRYFSKPIVFDRQSGYFYKGIPKMAYGIIDPNDKNIVPLSSIHVIQVVRELVRGKNTSYPSYEINLVLHDKTRVNVLDHGNLDAIRSDSKRLGEYLGVPVWGA